MSIQRETDDILADLTDFRAARTALIKGERVEDVWRDGRRMRLASASLAEINEAIKDLEREYAEAVAVAAGKPRRSAIGIYF